MWSEPLPEGAEDVDAPCLEIATGRVLPGGLMCFRIPGQYDLEPGAYRLSLATGVRGEHWVDTDVCVLVYTSEPSVGPL